PPVRRPGGGPPPDDHLAEEVAVTGLHWTPEDDPHAIGSAVNTWIKEIRG
ncbi:MAG: hypothetical protein QOI75_5903, partial [Pseudonocardiales bacterium]|nr:hypothetical protein [Pseudonocardiales bacterium]